jgi:hypothetical protein
VKTQVKALKVKIKSLAAEARIIRLEERKALGLYAAPAGATDYAPSGAPGGPKKPKRKGPARRDETLYLSLRTHRTDDVRREQRSALLAYAFVRGRKYGTVERPGDNNPVDKVRVKQLIEKFGGPPAGGYRCPPDVLAAWFAGTLDPHPFAPAATRLKSSSA